MAMIGATSCAPEVQYTKPGGTLDDLNWDRYERLAPAGSRMDRPLPSPNDRDRCLAKKSVAPSQSHGSTAH
jgi:hypothetical protein